MTREAVSRWNDAGNILCVRLDTIGDVIMTTPAIAALKESSPGRKLTLLTSSRGAMVSPLLPDLDDVIVYDPPWMKATEPGGPADDLGLINRLRESAFDAAVIFTVFTQSPLPAALLCHLAGIPLRLAHCRENPYQLLTDWVPETEPGIEIRHEAQRQLDLVATVSATTPDGRYRLSIGEAHRRRIRLTLEEMGLDANRPWCTLHPGASAPSRRYPPELFARAAQSLVARGWQIVLSGDASEVPLVDDIRRRIDGPCISLAGALSLGQLAALIEISPVLISNNTAPVHIASATGTPVVVLYALTNLQHTPWLTPHRVLSHDVPCRSCYKSVCPEGHHNCLRLVPPETVAEAALELAGHRDASPPTREQAAEVVL